LDSLICFSHLRWDFVWQRPQHLLSRLARDFKIYFVEEPITSTQAQEPFIETFPGAGSSNIEIVRLVQPSKEDYWIGHGNPQTQVTYNQLLSQFLQERAIKEPLIWFYTPMALDFLSLFPDYKLLIYDVMDQLAAFKGAPVELVDREKELLRRADIVLTGGLSLYRSKLPFNPETYLFPSGVEIEHFATAANQANVTRPAELEGLKGPILGYYGVIDERFDLELLRHLAQSRPDWTILLIGPVLKIDEADLPQSANLHYLGMHSYAELPSYLAFFDVALVPFALNEATQYLSPTKTLEYLAAGKPVVSTPINDIVELYGEVVKVAHTPAEFVSQVEAALAADPAVILPRAKEILSQATWDSIAEKIKGLFVQKINSLPLKS
jgi:UDP-galactopyranose mutase